MTSTDNTLRVTLSNDDWVALIKEISGCACSTRQNLLNLITDVIRQDGVLLPVDLRQLIIVIAEYRHSRDGRNNHSTGPTLLKFMEQIKALVPVPFS